jgi:hypothetical protein
MGLPSMTSVANSCRLSMSQVAENLSQLSIWVHNRDRAVTMLRNYTNNFVALQALTARLTGALASKFNGNRGAPSLPAFHAASNFSRSPARDAIAIRPSQHGFAFLSCDVVALGYQLMGDSWGTGASEMRNFMRVRGNFRVKNSCAGIAASSGCACRSRCS